MRVNFEMSAEEVETYRFVEIIARVEQPCFVNPYTDAELFGLFGEDKEPFTFQHGLPDGQLGTASNRDELIPVDGFCDSADGSLFRIRFMPTIEGVYTYKVIFKHGNQSFSSEGKFTANNIGRKGLLRVDSEFPSHFIWENTGDHFFYNGMTAYHLLGLRDEEEIKKALDRLHKHKVNRIRIAMQSSRVRNGMAWFEPVYESDEFKFLFSPWEADRLEDYDNPGWDTSRFHLPFWRKLERVLSYALEKEMSVSLIMYLDAYREGCDPFASGLFGGRDEQHYFRYAAARLSAYPNLTWDLTNEYRLIRPREWVERMGYLLKSCDPYRHLVTCHGHGTFEFRGSGWADFAVYQSWDEHGGYEYMLRNRNEQQATGRMIPQINEEYGYEDHYPAAWGAGKSYPARSADRLRRTAWEITMAGGYQTSGEYAGNGLGGWLNGRGDDSMRLPEALSHLVAFFEAIEWWKLVPDQTFLNADTGQYGLADPSRLYVVYACDGGPIDMKLPEGKYEIMIYNPVDGSSRHTLQYGVESVNQYVALQCPTDDQDWAVLIQALQHGIHSE
ncbi:apiosidase-like domain-containing protein [Paenibacillus sp. YIM B09110]|uniref:apiosidase-like domain-containing protein n=1 Tax=Paenibacillus sp. YIM B09110 TaxID=3126102 RepID=UPI00301C57E3